MSLEQNKQVALESLRVIETGDSVAADRIITLDFINREADDDPNRPDRGLRGPAASIATSRWLSSDLIIMRWSRRTNASSLRQP